jgi:2-polyprenyl-3-methyl-5-hydroxy-6-metoxy-1,4-benzoquinol methylase
MMRWGDYNMETVKNCPLCGSREAEEAYLFSPFKVIRCIECSLAYLSPRLEEGEMKRFYQDPSYYTSSSSLGYSDYDAQTSGLAKSFSLLAKRLAKMGVRGGSLLEIGCGPGLFLKEAKSMFATRVGMDFSESALERAKEHADEVIVGSVDSLEPHRRFDVIVGISLIEHVYEPTGFMRELVSHLEENGRIVIKLLNYYLVDPEQLV